MSSRVAMIVLGIIVLLIAVVLFDTFANWGKAYGNVTINGMSVAGMTAEDMRAALDENVASKLTSSQVTVYASEEARQRGADELAQQEDVATAEQISAEDAQGKKISWTADGLTLKAAIPYDQVIGEALSAGRQGGPFGRIAVAIGGEDIPLTVTFDETALDEFATEIDKTVGDARIDATVAVEDGQARVVTGHDGMMVDREWLSGRLSDVMLGKDPNGYVIAEASAAPSRTTMEQASQMRDAVNRALTAGADFVYQSSNWSADAVELGNWTRVDVKRGEGGAYELKAGIDSKLATSALVKHVSATTTSANSDSVIVDFEVENGEVVVKTTGSGEIPEVVPAIDRLNEALYGAGGVAWGSGGAPAPVKVEIGESNAPETLMLDQAIDLGLVTVIGEYTTEFSNEEGTENRNHNIKLASDLLNDSVCDSNGGKWSFNDLSGDTNLDPPFASAGSIVNGEYVDSIGGGICQVATTIFNAVYEAGLDVVERRNHSLYIASYPTGRDVGVSYPELNFVWSNPLKSDVLVRMSYTDTSLTCQLYSVYTGYKVESQEGEWQEGAKYSTIFETDDSMAKGDYYIKTTGEDGSRVSVTRTVTDKAGNVVSETVFDSVYEPKNEVYVVGPGTDTSGLGHDAVAMPQASEQETVYDEETGLYGEEALADGSGMEQVGVVEEAYDDGSGVGMADGEYY